MMSGNQKIYQEAMKRAADAAWDKSWDQAIEAYQSALAEFPEDNEALSGLGVAYMNVGQLEKALEAYQQAAQIEPDDPVVLQRIGLVQERLGQKRAAAEAYVASAKQYLDQQQAFGKALSRWKDAVRVNPHCIDAQVQLLKYYQRRGKKSQAVETCLALARAYREQGQRDYAVRICQYALNIDPHHKEVLSLLDELRYGERQPEESLQEESVPLLQEEPEREAEPEPTVTLEEPPELTDLDLDVPVAQAERGEERGSPVETTRLKALTELAESVFEEGEEAPAEIHPQLSKEEIDAFIGQAIDFQMRGKIVDAISAYERVVEAGGERPAVRFNLGLLYQEKLRFEDAIDQFERVVSHPDYRLGSHFALGECYRARGRIDEALEHFVEVLRIVDLAVVQREHADDLIQLYEHLADGYLAKGDKDKALSFASSLVDFLSEQGWEDKVKQARRRLDTLAQEGPTLSLAEMLAVPDSESLLESIALAQEYSKRKMFYAALEECYYAMDYAPHYLPLHRQLAEVFLGMRLIDEGVQKLIVIADTYRVRKQIRRAIGTYRHVLKLAPMDTNVRADLIDLLINHGEIDQGLEHYLIMADSYYNLAQIDKAREVYQSALQLAPRGDPDRRWEIRILHKVGDINMQRVEWRDAIEVYERIRDLAPDDERARLTLMNLYYRLDQPRRAINELDQLLEIYRQSDEPERIFTVLEDVIQRWPESIPLRARLAQAYLDAGDKEQALAHLDELGDLQLEAGRQEEAKATIRAIIALRPPDVEDYRRLLEQLENRSQ